MFKTFHSRSSIRCALFRGQLVDFPDIRSIIINSRLQQFVTRIDLLHCRRQAIIWWRENCGSAERPSVVKVIGSCPPSISLPASKECSLTPRHEVPHHASCVSRRSFSIMHCQGPIHHHMRNAGCIPSRVAGGGVAANCGWIEHADIRVVTFL